MTSPYPSIEQVQEARVELRDLAYQHWIHDDFLTWRWWLLLALTILPWLIWWLIIDKNRLRETLLFGMLMSVISISMDNIGTDLVFWEYPDKLFQMVPPLFPADLSLIPTSMMLCYQWGETWWRFITIVVVFAFFVSFAGEQIFQWLHFYRPVTWSSLYSFPIYIALAMFGRMIVAKTGPKERV